LYSAFLGGITQKAVFVSIRKLEARETMRLVANSNPSVSISREAHSGPGVWRLEAWGLKLEQIESARQNREIFAIRNF
jgi:hypothetical protein